VTIRFEEFKTRLLTNPKVKSEYEALPSTKTLLRFAKATGSRVRLRLTAA